MSEHERIKVELGQKRVRGYLDGTLVVDTTRSLLVWEIPHYPAWYLPVADVTPGLLKANERVDRSPRRGPAHRIDLIVGDRTVPDAAWHPTRGSADRDRVGWRYHPRQASRAAV